MHPLVRDSAILAVIAQLLQLCLGTWTPGKAVAIQFYTSSNDGCAQYTGDATIWWTSSPLVGDNATLTGAGCDLLNMPGNTTGINITMMWGQSTTSDTVEPAQANGGCTFWDEYECGTGHSVSLAYVPGEAGNCQAGRSDQGDDYLWKSAKCFVDAAATQAPPPSSTSVSAIIPVSTVSASMPPQSTTSAGRNSLSSATIAGIATGAASLVVIFILLAFFIGRRNRQKPEVLLPYLQMQMPMQHGPEAQCQSSVPQVSEKSTRSTVGTLQDSLPRSATSEARQSHQLLIAGELRALRQEVERLNSAVASGDGYDARIRALERELQSYGDAERPEPSLPGYSD
ncbi:hypothetical protein MSAN_00974400 [Mycena sanguinolenta]|uniref:Uncharacterized protein n=1 Tax=Mycena sanguinolenta TaxID=230812 RepID=A0A8H6YY79_9AGAR|nr:hypothetical protein MSAN_00974400 [Mycena sanguinolenta]